MKRFWCILMALALLSGCGMGPSVDTDPTWPAQPSVIPTTEPTTVPATEPTTAPTTEPTTIPTTEPTTLPTEPPQPQLRSILDFLRIAVQPVGSTMYVWGGGWNEEDTGAGVEAVTLGVSSRWAEFTAQQDKDYDFHKTRYQIHDGLDCSGYVGWAVYNVMEGENGRPGYVYSATRSAAKLAERGLGELLGPEQIDGWLPGDVVSMEGHCWIVVGMCQDGSMLLLHASPPGVIFCGTDLPDGSKSQAVLLAEKIMAEYYPQWYAKYPNCSRGAGYLDRTTVMRWHADVLMDEEKLREMSAEGVVSAIFGQ